MTGHQSGYGLGVLGQRLFDWCYLSVSFLSFISVCSGFISVQTDPTGSVLWSPATLRVTWLPPNYECLSSQLPTLPRTSPTTLRGPQSVYCKSGNRRWKLILLGRKRDISDFIREHYKSACWARYVLPLLLSVEEILNKLSSRWSSLLNYFSPSASDSPDRLSQHWIYLNPSDQITLSSSGLWCMENKWCKWNSVWHLLRREQMFR